MNKLHHAIFLAESSDGSTIPKESASISSSTIEYMLLCHEHLSASALISPLVVLKIATPTLTV